MIDQLPNVRTSRLTLRPRTMDDLEACLAMVSDAFETAGTDLIFLQGALAAVLSGGTDTVIDGARSDTIAVLGAANADTVFGGAGSLAFVNGQSVSAVLRGSGTATIFGGAGAVGGSETITNFSNDDRITLQGYGANAIASTLASASLGAAGLTLTLPDAIKLTLVGVASLNSCAFV